MSVVVFAVGNPSRGDDALGPLLMDWLAEQARPGVQLVSDFQLQIEHALDLEGHSLALFIDAGTGTPAPFEFRETGPAATAGLRAMRAWRRLRPGRKPEPGGRTQYGRCPQFSRALPGSGRPRALASAHRQRGGPGFQRLKLLRRR